MPKISLTVSPPAVVIRRSESAGRVWGKARFCVVILPHDAPYSLEVHELHHVKQWWMCTIPSAVLLFCIAAYFPSISYYIMALSVATFGTAYHFSSWFRYRAEVGAYRENYLEQPLELYTFSKMLSDPRYGGRKSGWRECMRDITDG